MATKLSDYFRIQRQELGLRLDDVAGRMGYGNLVRAAKKISRFEERGDISFALFTKLMAALDMDEATIHRLMEEDRRELVRRWNEWANQPITPHLIVCLVPGFFLGQHIPEGVATPQEMEKYASRLAESTGNTVWLILSRRLSIRFGEDGIRRAVSEASPTEPCEPFPSLRCLQRRSLPTCDGGQIELQALDAPRWHGPKEPPTIETLEELFGGTDAPQ